MNENNMQHMITLFIKQKLGEVNVIKRYVLKNRNWLLITLELKGFTTMIHFATARSHVTAVSEDGANASMAPQIL